MITINGRQFPGNSVEIIDGIAYIDGKAVDVDLQGGVDLSMESDGEEQNLNLTADGNKENITIHQRSTTGDNKISFSFWRLWRQLCAFFSI